MDASPPAQDLNERAGPQRPAAKLMQFKTKLGLVDIPNDEVLAAADAIRGPVTRDRPDRCTYTLREQGKPYPRTCEVCALGPCQYGHK